LPVHQLCDDAAFAESNTTGIWRHAKSNIKQLPPVSVSYALRQDKKNATSNKINQQQIWRVGFFDYFHQKRADLRIDTRKQYNILKIFLTGHNCKEIKKAPNSNCQPHEKAHPVSLPLQHWPLHTFFTLIYLKSWRKRFICHDAAVFGRVHGD